MGPQAVFLQQDPVSFPSLALMGHPHPLAHGLSSLFRAGSRATSHLFLSLFFHHHIASGSNSSHIPFIRIVVITSSSPEKSR